MDEKFDIIVIGSGMGGMAAASTAAQLLEARVLVIEQHYRFGGYMHTFKRPGGFEWDVGVHYLGNMRPGSANRALFDFVTRKGVDWQKMEEPFEHYEFPCFKFDQVGNPQQFKHDLQKRFPYEQKAIEQYFVDVKVAAKWLERRFLSLVAPFPANKYFDFKNSLDEKFCLQTTKDYLDAHFQDERLKAILASQWGDCGEPPGRCAFTFHASIVKHYLRGGYYPVGGAGKVAESVIPIIEEKGGSCLVRHKALEILLEGNRAIGVEVETKYGKKIFLAKNIISDAGAFNTYTKLLPSHVGPDFAKDISKSGLSAVVMYVGFKQSPKEIGFNGGNHWIYTSLNHDEMAKSLLTGKVSGCYISFPSLKDSSRKVHLAEIITFAHYDMFKEWKDQPWRNRGEEYECLKKNLTDSLLDLVEQQHPGFRDIVSFTELSTPLSNIHFTDHPQGTIFGMAGTPERFKNKSIGIQTPVKNLYLAGADSFMPGVLPCLLSGIGAAARVIGPFGIYDVQKEIKRRA